MSQRRVVQSRQVFLSETILLVSPFMQIHAAMLGTRDATKERHAVLGRTIARPHDVVTTSRRGRSVHCSDSPSSIFSAMICDIQTNDRCAAARGSTLDDDDLRDLTVLAEILARAQRRDELSGTLNERL